MTDQTALDRFGIKPKLKCPKCGSTMISVKTFKAKKGIKHCRCLKCKHRWKEGE